ncbi:VOC family protein [Natrialba swarupiae]|uniref:Catechol 1,2-dioxygenase n=1 Tax=Natrialba swarupiae TaxID=2448032 RepID=A0A5D5AIG9_9EURY|nr:VOC family protein [Natrialba swarupiae]TYT60934.1 catechol 1,2-dioxygenase [Natrialba swarupiae]
MTGVRKLEHATMAVTDLEESVDCYTDVFGLDELDRRDGVVYLGCGLDENYDLALTEGGTGIEHFAIRLTDAEIDAYERRLADTEADVRRTDGAEPGQESGVRVSLPSGIDVELVSVADTRYLHPTKATADRLGVAPLDLDHINLMSDAIEEDVAFLEDHLDFDVSDEIVEEDGSTVQSWMRHGRFHHDAGFTRTDDPAETLHHIAFQFESFDHIKLFCDRLAQHGYQLEYGPSRHNAGSNLFAYFWGPGGNRIELSAEMATLDPDTETGVRVLEEESNTVSSWGGSPPKQEFLEKGS